MGAQLKKPVISKYLISQENLNRLEREVLEFSGVPMNCIWQLDVKIDRFQDQNVYIRTIIVSDKNLKRLQVKNQIINNIKDDDELNDVQTSFSSQKEILVLLHGYSQSSALFFPIIKKLYQYFDLILVDIIGMGGSSRPQNYLYWEFTPQQSIDYFVDSLEKWRVNMKFIIERLCHPELYYKRKIQKKQQQTEKVEVEIVENNVNQEGEKQELNEFKDFILAGHCLGGYIAGNYSLKYRHFIKKLLLLSPIGCRPLDADEEDMTDYELEQQNIQLQSNPVWLQQIAKFQWKNKISPYSFNRFLGQNQTYKIFKKYVEQKWIPPGTLNVDQKETLVDYLYQIFTKKGTTEYAPMINFKITLQAIIPLGTEDKLADKENQTPISFIYGDNDWVQIIEQDIADIILETKNGYRDRSQVFVSHILKGDNSFRQSQLGEARGINCSQIHIVPTSDHNMHMDNPMALANAIINDIYDSNLPIQKNRKLIKFSQQINLRQNNLSVEHSFLADN